MDNMSAPKRNRSFFVSLIIAAVFWAGIVFLHVYTLVAGGLLDTLRIVLAAFRNPEFDRGLLWGYVTEHLMQYWPLGREGYLTAVVMAVFFLLPLLSFLALAFNALAWTKPGGKSALVAGVLHLFAVNPVSATICLVGYVDNRFGVKNKPLLYSAILSCWFVVVWTANWVFVGILFPFGIREYGVLQGVIFFGVFMAMGVLLNFLACKKDCVWLRLLAGFFYILGLFTIAPAVVCLRKSGVENRLLFFTAMFSASFTILWTAAWVLAHAFTEAPLIFVLYPSIAMAGGVVLNFIAWKNGDIRLRLLAGFFYILGLFTIAPAVICLRKSGVENRLLFFTAMFSASFTILWTAAWVLAHALGAEDVLVFVLYPSIAMAGGALLNFIAWKNGNVRLRLLAGFFYILGLFTIAPAVICLRKSGVENRLLFFTAMFSCVFAIFTTAFWVFDLVTLTGGLLSVGIYMTVVIIGGVVFNFLAWKYGNRKLKIAAGVFYVLGIYTIVSAVICFISCRSNQQKAITVEG